MKIYPDIDGIRIQEDNLNNESHVAEGDFLDLSELTT